MKKILIALIVVILIWSVFFRTDGSKEMLNEFYLELEAGQLEEVRERIYTGREDEILGAFKHNDILTEDEIFPTIISQNFSFEVQEIEVEDDIAIAELEITIPVIEEVFNHYMNARQQEINKYLVGEIDEEKLRENNRDILIESFQNANRIFGIEEAILRREEGEWKIYDWSFDSIKLASDSLIEKYNHPFVSEAEEVIALFWYHIKELDLDRSRDYVYPDQEEILAIFNQLEESDGVYSELEEVWEDSFLLTTYGTEEIDEERAIVNVEFTIPDLDELLTDEFPERFSYDLLAYYQDNISYSELEERMVEAIVESLKEVGTESAQKEVILSKYDEEWRIYDLGFDLDLLDEQYFLDELN